MIVGWGITGLVVGAVIVFIGKGGAEASGRGGGIAFFVMWVGASIKEIIKNQKKSGTSKNQNSK